MYTQQQAQSLWCPLRGALNSTIPLVAPSLPPHERPTSTSHPTCVGEACALWRWRAVQMCETDQNCTEYCHSCPTRRGYCGYGGTPETL